MTTKKILVIAAVLLTLIASLAMAVPVLAAGNTTPPNPAQITQVNKAKVLVRLLLVQDEAKVDAFIAGAVTSGKLTKDQAGDLKDFWTAHHQQFARNFILKRLLGAQDKAKVKTFLDNAVKAGKIQPAQETKILQVWDILHSK
jgi:hypothetical protein